jgi:uncharacterized protein YjbI with pentapeptide repeats
MGQKFFISFNSADRTKAHWIAWTLEEAGHEVAVHDWEIPAGGNVPLWMSTKLAWADRLIAVISPDYLPSRYSPMEWASQIWNDPDGTKGSVIPVIVRPTAKLPPLLGGLSRIDLTNCSEDKARRRLINGVDMPAPPELKPAFEKIEGEPPDIQHVGPSEKPTFVRVSEEVPRGKAFVPWTIFIIFQLYLAIAFGSVTHRDVFLEAHIRLPLLNVDLPLIGFFAVAPTLLVIFHFYVFTLVATDRQYIRQRLDVFPILQFLAGPRDQRTGLTDFSMQLIAWITLVATPVLILLQAQVTFLPYHSEWIVWLQRVAVLIDLALIWYFWNHLRSDDDPINGVLRKAWVYLGGAGTLCVVIFSTYLATFPGEWMKTHLPELSSLQALLFEGDVDPVSGRPQSVFSNRLVLTNQSFVADPEKLDKITVSHRFRGRDLRLAVLYLADLRKADFTGAQLQGASLDRARLQGASLQQAQLQGASLDRAQLQGASLDSAQLQGASLQQAQLQGASLDRAQLQGASLDWAELQGASLDRAQLQGASLDSAQLQGASLDEARLQGTWLAEARLQGASLHWAQLQGASLFGAQLQGASLDDARLQGASLDRAELQGTGLANVLVWRAFGTPKLDLAQLANIDAHQKPWNDNETFGKWRHAIANSVPVGCPRDRVIDRLAVLDPTGKKEPEDVLEQGPFLPAAGRRISGKTCDVPS